MADKRPAFQWYPQDHLSDLHVVIMTLEEEGAYRRLTDFCWIEGSLPTDPKALARLCKTDPAHMEELLPAILPCFIEKEGRLIHPRLEVERSKQDAHRNSKVKAGKKGAKARWDREKDSTALTLPLAEDGSSSSSSTSSSTSETDVFEYWRRRREEVIGATAGPRMKQSDKRLSKIRARISEGYTFEQLREAIDGCLSNPHNIEGGYLDIELICRNQQKVEQYRAYNANGGKDSSGDDWESTYRPEWAGSE